MNRTVRQLVVAAGGPPKIADESAGTDAEISEKGVYSWHRVGINQKYWRLMMRLSGASERELFEANELLKSSPQAADDCARVA